MRDSTGCIFEAREKLSGLRVLCANLDARAPNARFCAMLHIRSRLVVKRAARLTGAMLCECKGGGGIREQDSGGEIGKANVARAFRLTKLHVHELRQSTAAKGVTGTKQSSGRLAGVFPQPVSTRTASVSHDCFGAISV